jgi:hypothetical protein
MYLGWSHVDRGDLEQVIALKEDVLHKIEERFNLRWYVRLLD